MVVQTESSLGRRIDDSVRADGPQGLPLIGILPNIRRDPLRYLLQVSRDYSDVINLNFGLQRVFMVTKPEYVGHVLRDNYKNYRKSDFYRVLRPVIGRGLLMAEGEAWRQQRQAAQPAFHHAAIAGMTKNMTEAISDMLVRWERQFANGKPFSLSVEMTRLTLDVLFRTLVNVRLDDQTDSLFDSLMFILRETERRVWNLTQISEHIPTRTNRKYQRCVRDLESLVERIIDDRRRDVTKHQDLLALLFDAYTDSTTGEVNSTLLRDEIMTSVIAGHETTASALTWTFFLLSKNPAAERLVRHEAQHAYNGTTPGFEDLEKIPYTKMVIQESLRLFPPAWTMSRTALDDDWLGPYRIPKGSNLMLSPYVVHRNPNYWENPEGFDPERFRPEVAADRHPYAYFPFGGGPRGCIGERFGLLEAQLVLAMVAPIYRLELVPGVTIEPEAMITLRPKNGAQVTLRRQPHN